MIAAGVAAFAFATVTSSRIEQLLLGTATGALSWGGALFRALLALHGIVLVGCGVYSLRPRSTSAHANGEPAVYPRTPRVVWILLGFLCAVALPLRLYRLDSDLWIDEVFTLVDFARLPVGKILTSFPSQNQHMLYSLSAKAAIAVWGDSAWSLRLPAVLFGVLSIPALFLLARRLTDSWQAMGVSALMTLSYHHIWFSQNGRGYTGVLFFTILSTWLWVEALPQRRWRPWLAYVAAVALGGWIHMTMAFVAAGHGLTYLALLVCGRRREAGACQLGGVSLGRWWLPLAAMALCGTLTLQLYALSLPDFLRNAFHEGSPRSEWTSVRWLIAETVRGLGLGYAGATAVLAAAVVPAIGWGSIFRRHWVAAVAMLAPPVAVCGFMLMQGHNLWPRFVFFSAGAAILATVHGVVVIALQVSRRLAPMRKLLPPPVWAAGAIVLMIVISAATIPRNYALPKQDYTGAREYVEQCVKPSEVVVSVGLAGFMYSRYYAPEWVHAESAETLASVIRRHPGVWLVYVMPTNMRTCYPGIWAIVEREFETVRVFPGTLGGGEVYVCRTAPSRAESAGG